MKKIILFLITFAFLPTMASTVLGDKLSNIEHYKSEKTNVYLVSGKKVIPTTHEASKALRKAAQSERSDLYMLLDGSNLDGTYFIYSVEIEEM